MDRYFLEKIVLQIGSVIAIGAILGGFILAYNGTYNTVVSLERSVDEEWSRLSQDLNQRYSPIPGIVNASRPSMGSSGPLLDEVVRARDHWQVVAGRGDVAGVGAATEELESANERLLAALSGFPQLRESLPVKEYIAMLEGTEGRISTDRQRYNRAVQDYNRTIHSFPASLWVENWGFQERVPFTARIGSEGPP